MRRDILEEKEVDRIGGGVLVMKPYQIFLDHWFPRVGDGSVC